MRAIRFATAVAGLTLLMVACQDESEPTEGGREPTAGPQGETAPVQEPRRTPGPAASPEPTAEFARLALVGVENDDRTVLIDLDAGEVIEGYPTPGGPHNVTVAHDGTAAALYATNDLAVIRDEEIEIVTLGDRPHDVKATDDWFIVANEAGRRLDYVSLEGEPGLEVALPGEPHDVAIAPDGRHAWATMNGTDELAVVDLDAAELARLVPTGHAPHDLLFAPDGRLWITDWTGLLLVLSPEGEIDHTRELGVEAHHLTFTPDGSEAWITDHGTNELFVLDTRTVEVLETIPLPGAPHHVAITPDGALTAVADHTNGDLLVFDAESREHVETISVGPGPHGVWAVPDN